MLELRLSRHRKARVWLAHPLPSRIMNGVVMERMLAASRQGLAGSACAAIEVLVPAGGHCLYGLLGGEIGPGQSGQMTVRVLSSTDQGAPLDDSIALDFEDVRVGIPEPYVESVFRGALRVLKEQEEPAPGYLEFNWGAHGQVGSCPVLFGWLASILTRVLHTAEQRFVEKALVEMLETPVEITEV